MQLADFQPKHQTKDLISGPLPGKKPLHDTGHSSVLETVLYQSSHSKKTPQCNFEDMLLHMQL